MPGSYLARENGERQLSRKSPNGSLRRLINWRERKEVYNGHKRDVKGTKTRIDGIPLDEAKTGVSVTITTKELPRYLIMDLSGSYQKEVFITFASSAMEDSAQTNLFKQKNATEEDDRPLPFPAP